MENKLNSRTKAKIFFTALKSTYDDQRVLGFAHDRFANNCKQNYKNGVEAFLLCMQSGDATKPHTKEYGASVNPTQKFSNGKNILATGFRQ